MHKHIQYVIDFCHGNLKNGNNEVIDYLYERRITKDSINKFKLGFFPTKLSDLININTIDKLDAEYLREIDIIKSASYSSFSLYKLIFPIYDLHNKPVAIAGRLLLDEKKRKEYGFPKYLNSKYSKSSHLFGLNIARDSIRRNNAAIVVEGYLDVITSHQHGIDNVVATCGVALSEMQISLLARYTDNIYVLFDNDKAGESATSRVEDLLLKEDTNFFKCNMRNDYNDIDEMLRKEKVKQLNFFDNFNIQKMQLPK